MEKIVQTDEPHLVKNMATGVVLNNDVEGYKSYLIMREANESKRRQMLTIEQEVENIKEDITEIKNLLKYLIEKN
jgi:hypothetical protein